MNKRDRAGKARVVLSHRMTFGHDQYAIAKAKEGSMSPLLYHDVERFEAEIRSLQAINSALVDALEAIWHAPQGPNLAGSIQAMRDKARAALAKVRH